MKPQSLSGSVAQSRQIPRASAYKGEPDTSGKTLIETIRSHRSALTADQLASLLGIRAKQIYKLAKNGRLPVYRFGASIRLDPRITADWLECRLSAAA